MFLLCSGMPGTVLPDRVQRLKDWISMPSNHLMVAHCRDCGHRAALPVALLLRRFGTGAPVDRVMETLACSACQGRTIEVRSTRLCDPGCARQRG